MSGGYTLIDADGVARASEVPGALGGHRGSRIYGRLDCLSARRAIGRGGYVASRVFFADAETARAAGYRPCARCLPAEYRAWRAATSSARAASSLIVSTALPSGQVTPRTGRRRHG